MEDRIMRKDDELRMRAESMEQREEIKRLRGVVDDLRGELAFHGHNPNKLTTRAVTEAGGE